MSSTLKDLMKLAGLKVTTLAEVLGMEYSHVSTVLQMDERGEEPKRSSVRLRAVLIREHLEMLQQVAERGEDGAKKRRTVWDSVEEAGRRFPAPAGCAQTFEHGGLHLGSRVRLTLDPAAGAEIFRFLRKVEREGCEPYIDVFSTETGALRSVRMSKIEGSAR